MRQGCIFMLAVLKPFVYALEVILGRGVSDEKHGAVRVLQQRTDYNLHLLSFRNFFHVQYLFIKHRRK